MVSMEFGFGCDSVEFQALLALNTHILPLILVLSSIFNEK